MLEVVVFTLFPQMFAGVVSESILKRATEQGLVRIQLVNFRDFATDRHRTVDDYPFGGGAGMLLKPEPLFRAVESVRAQRTSANERTVLLSPQGQLFTQDLAREFAGLDRLLLICGHYEGFDDRVRQHLVTDEISIGDFVMTGGEIAAMAVLDAVVRLVPGVLGNEGSPDDDSFSVGLLEYPQFTRPAVFRGWAVPAVLLSGHHANIAAWRRRHALYRTWVRRPDLLQHVQLSAEEQRWIGAWEAGNFEGIDVLEDHHAWRQRRTCPAFEGRAADSRRGDPARG
ncbi:MAG: tRNA (guanosine(37)-N1)-methyltransferase TrmD [Alicyclobacillaceae bacterium]|nr:tRNA (guanosine(37)-N1)-methyltransferase TrmD [Alicyclobacillaceae bacterium]